MDKKLKKFGLIITGFIVICLVLVVIIWSQEEKAGDLQVIFFDVGQGDSILIQTPSGHDILIDGGPDSSVLSKIGRQLAFYDHSIDLIVLSHAHSDHVAGLVDVLKRYDVNKVLYTGVDHSSPDFIAWKNLIEEKNIEMEIPIAGHVYQFDNVSLEILFPFEDISAKEIKDLNDTSIVARLDYGQSCFLFTGDAPATIEEELLQHGSNLECDILKVGHHGSKYSSSLDFLRAIDSEQAVIQSGEGNTFNHPHRLILKRLGGLGMEILRNDEMGDVELQSDGTEIWLK